MKYTDDNNTSNGFSCFSSPDWKQNLKDGENVSLRGQFQALTQRTPAGQCASLEPNPPAHRSHDGTASLASRRQGSYYQRSFSRNPLLIYWEPPWEPVNIQQRDELMSTEREAETGEQSNIREQGCRVEVVWGDTELQRLRL